MSKLAAVNLTVGIIALLVWMLTIMGGVNLPGLRSWYYVKLTRSYQSTVNDPLSIWSTSNLFNFNPMDSVNLLEVPSNEMRISLRNWCLFAYRFGRDSSYYRLWDAQNIPYYEIEQRDGLYDENTMVQCVHPKIALKSPKTMITMSQILNTNRNINYNNPAMFDPSGSYFVAIESLNYVVLFATCFAVIGYILMVYSDDKDKILNMGTLAATVIALVASIIVMIMWTVVLVKIQNYVINTKNSWGYSNGISVVSGACFWLTVAGIFLLLILTLSSCVITFGSKSNRTFLKRVSSVYTVEENTKANDFTRKNVEKV